MCPGYERQTWAVLELLIISGGLEEKQKESDRNANLGSHLANKRFDVLVHEAEVKGIIIIKRGLYNLTAVISYVHCLSIYPTLLLSDSTMFEHMYGRMVQSNKIIKGRNCLQFHEVVCMPDYFRNSQTIVSAKSWKRQRFHDFVWY